MSRRLRRESGSAVEEPPRLVLRFAAFTAAGVALAAALIVVVVRQESTEQVQRHALDRARFATEAVLQRELRSADLRSRPPKRRRAELDRLFRDRVLLGDIRGAALYGAKGRLLYASRAGSSGGTFRTSVRIVLVGPPRTTGVAAFEHDLAPLRAEARRAAWLVAAVLEALLLLLFLLVAPTLVRVRRRIRAQVVKIEHAATHDELTQTPNRVAFRRAVERRLASGSPTAVVLLDLDGFSGLNHVFGSDGGDALLLEAALRLRWGLAGCELVARLGDDEFGILLDTADPAEIAAVAAQAREAVGRPFVLDGVRVAVGSRVGAAAVHEGEADFATVLRRAGAALAAAKEEGREPVQLWGPGHEEDELSRAALAVELQEALARRDLLVHYQPQADLLTRQVRGVEALLRWRHPERGLLAAGAFVAALERSPLAGDVRRVVLETSARRWAEWHRLGLELELGVNLSPADVVDLALPDEVANLLEQHSMPPWNLVLEITERTLVADERRAGRVLERLHELGVRLAIDDFGTGYSSLSSLRRFPVQLVKLDRSLLAGAPGDPAAVAIVRGSVEMAHAIGAVVLAEGIETEEQLTFAHALGCDIAQGYLIGRPLPADELAQLVLEAPVVTAA